jgi:rhodanese-related sulfurtransferase
MNTTDMPPIIEPLRLARLMRERPGLRLLDVRTPGEYEAAHIHGAYNVPLETLAEHAADIRAHVKEPGILGCQTGGRARRAEDAL